MGSVDVAPSLSETEVLKYNLATAPETNPPTGDSTPTYLLSEEWLLMVSYMNEFDGTTTHLNGYFSSQVDKFRYVIVLGRYQNRMYKILTNNLKGEGNPTTVVCRKAHVLFTLFVYVYVMLCLPHIVLCFCFVFLRLLYHVASSSGVFPFYWPFGIL